jgi:hypothetical protein
MLMPVENSRPVIEHISISVPMLASYVCCVGYKVQIETILLQLPHLKNGRYRLCDDAKGNLRKFSPKNFGKRQRGGRATALRIRRAVDHTLRRVLARDTAALPRLPHPGDSTKVTTLTDPRAFMCSACRCIQGAQ